MSKYLMSMMVLYAVKTNFWKCKDISKTINLLSVESNAIKLKNIENQIFES